MSNNEIKWKISIFSMCLFILVTNEMSYKFTNSLFGKILDENNKITTVGYVLHVTIFLLLVRYTMELNLFDKTL